MARGTSEYAALEVAEYGTVGSVTEQSNKEGPTEDQYTDATDGAIVGSVVPIN